MRLARICLRVQNAAALSAFYRSILGMEDFGTEDAPALGYDPAQCLLALRDGASAPAAPGPQDFYWKIGITLRDLDVAVAHLHEVGWPVSEPRQFRDIGYLCHLRDPEGLAVELLQQGFEGRAGPPGDGHPIGGQATLAHLTLRVADLEAARAFCEERLGMRLMSVQPVAERGFTLYFYAWSQEPLPDPRLEAVENREWLWARPYALLELQHLESAERVVLPEAGAAGFTGFAYGAAETLTSLALPDLAALYRAAFAP